MAAIAPVPANLAPGVEQILWETLTESDTATAQLTGGIGPAIGSVQFVGTFGSATVVLQGSNDNSNWVTLQDFEGAPISFAVTGAADFSTAMAYIRPSATGGSSQDLDVYLVTRG